MITIGEQAHRSALIRAGDDVQLRAPTSEPAHGRAPARGEPAGAGVPWAFESEVEAGGHQMVIGGVGIVIELLIVNPHIVRAERPETQNRAADDRLTRTICQGWAGAHAK
jgi:hypothetical protein